jgi:predicted Rossmann-fold nucleotide-binding protein
MLTDGMISPEDLDLLYVTDDLDEAVQDVISSYGTRSAETPAEPKKADAQ